MLENPQLHENVVSKLQHILHHHNPFVNVFRQLTLRTNVHQYCLIIKENPSNQPQYNIPTTSQVAAIIVVGDVETLINGRDIKIGPNDRSLLLRLERLLQQYVVNHYVKVAVGRLRWIRQNQNNIWAEVCQVNVGCKDPNSTLARMERVCGLIHENPTTLRVKMWLERKMGKMLEVEDEYAL
ncbi:hypothetical protein Lal_00039681 [Lupinus albus]|nr:hypothetical protein Lal_00039681 [Lupinus albus]